MQLLAVLNSRLKNKRGREFTVRAPRLWNILPFFVHFLIFVDVMQTILSFYCMVCFTSSGTSLPVSPTLLMISHSSHILAVYTRWSVTAFTPADMRLCLTWLESIMQPLQFLLFLYEYYNTEYSALLWKFNLRSTRTLSILSFIDT